MECLKTILTVALAVLLVFPAVSASTGAVFCIEADGSVSVEGSGCDCASERGQGSHASWSDVDTAQFRDAVEPCKPCVDIPLNLASETVPLRIGRATSGSVNVLSLAFADSANWVVTASAITSDSISTLIPHRVSNARIAPLRI